MTTEELNGLKNKFSVKNFITELPNMLNNAFATICTCITEFYVPEEKKIKCTKAEIGTIESTTIIAQNLKLKGANSQQFNYADIPNMIKRMQDKINEIVDDFNKLEDRDVVLSKLEYDALDPKDPSKFYYVYEQTQTND